MKTYTVKQLAHLAGISVRALHHYDDIGLLKPAFTGENRYRYYGPEELLRLQQILIHRELGVPLSDIAAILDKPGFDRLAALQLQRQRLQEQAERFATMVETIDRTIAKLQGDRAMTDAQLYSGLVSPDKQGDYHRWLVDRFGPQADRQIRQSQGDQAEPAVFMAELREIEEALAEAMGRGVPPQSGMLDGLIERHRNWVGARWNGPVSHDAYRGLAEMYAEHPDFVARYEQITSGFTEYLTSAMQSWIRRQD